MKFSRTDRSDQVEIMDDNQFQGKEMQDLLADLNFINTWLGGDSVTIKGLRTLLKKYPNLKEITVVDIGCGDGSTLRLCTDYARKNDIKLKGIGIDFNDYILDEAIAKSRSYSNLTFQNTDVFQNSDKIPSCDIVVCSLFLHHFTNEDIEGLLTHLIHKTKIGLVVNDLHRSGVAFNLFKLINLLFLKTKTAAHDGLVSINKGFRKQELITLSQKIPIQKSTVSWQWAFRYLWILKKEEKSL